VPGNVPDFSIVILPDIFMLPQHNPLSDSNIADGGVDKITSLLSGLKDLRKSAFPVTILLDDARLYSRPAVRLYRE